MTLEELREILVKDIIGCRSLIKDVEKHIIFEKSYRFDNGDALMHMVINYIAGVYVYEYIYLSSSNEIAKKDVLLLGAALDAIKKL